MSAFQADDDIRRTFKRCKMGRKIYLGAVQFQVSTSVLYWVSNWNTKLNQYFLICVFWLDSIRNDHFFLKLPVFSYYEESCSSCSRPCCFPCNCCSRSRACFELGQEIRPLAWQKIQQWKNEQASNAVLPPEDSPSSKRWRRRGSVIKWTSAGKVGCHNIDRVQFP